MDTAAKGLFKESKIEATVMRVLPPEPGDPRPWQQNQCPHCQRIYWSWAKGVISYWHKSWWKRMIHRVRTFKQGE